MSIDITLFDDQPVKHRKRSNKPVAEKSNHKHVWFRFRSYILMLMADGSTKRRMLWSPEICIECNQSRNPRARTKTYFASDTEWIDVEIQEFRRRRDSKWTLPL